LSCRTRLLGRCQSSKTSNWKVSFLSPINQLIIRSISHPHRLFLSFIFKNIIKPLAKSWQDDDILNVIEQYLLVLTPDVSPFLLFPSNFPTSLPYPSFLSSIGFSCFIQMGSQPHHSHHRSIIYKPDKSHTSTKETLPFDPRTPRFFRAPLVLLSHWQHRHLRNFSYAPSWSQSWHPHRRLSHAS
jgi:hypothetical protein